MFRKLTLIVLATSLFSGCATVPMESDEAASRIKAFNPPPEGHAGLYIYRSMGPGTALKKDIWVDGQCIGESAPNVFFYEVVKGNQPHKVSTESEFSPNDLLIETESGRNYFVEQYIKFGVFVGGANLKLENEEEGKKKVSSLQMAMKGSCNN